MAQLKIPAADFYLTCEFTCRTTNYWELVDGSKNVFNTEHGIKVYSVTQSTTIPFAFSIPEKAVITSAKVYATLSSPLYGAAISRINGAQVGTAKTVSVDVNIADGASAIDVGVQFLCNTPSHTHAVDSGSFGDAIWQEDDGSWGYEEWHFPHESRLDYTDVYLLIEYEGGNDGYVYRAESGELVPYRLCRAEGGKLVPYRLHRAESGKLVPY